MRPRKSCTRCKRDAVLYGLCQVHCGQVIRSTKAKTESDNHRYQGHPDEIQR